MPDQKISADPLITTPLTTDYVPIISGGDNKRVTIANLVANSNPASLTISGLTAGRVTYAGTAGLLSDDSGFTYNSATHALTATTFIGALTGNATTASNLSGTPALPNGTTATTQSQADNSTKLATTAYVDTGLGTKQATITFGTGVQTALGVNVGSAGAPVLFNGNAGTPSALVGTNISGTASSLTAGAVTGFTAGAGVLTGPASAGVAETLGNNETITGIKTFSPTARSSGSASYLTVNAPADTGITTATESIGVDFVTATRTFVDGTVALQRERFFAGPTYNKTTTSATFTDVFNAYFTPPVAGTGVTFTRGHTLGIVDSTSASSSITGGFIVATTLGTTATSVGIGGGNVNAGGNGTFGGTLAVTGHVTLEGVTSTGATGTGKFVFDGSPTIDSATMTTSLIIPNGTVTQPATRFASETNTGIYRPGANNLGITIGGTVKGQWDANHFYSNDLVFDIANADLKFSRVDANTVQLTDLGGSNFRDFKPRSVIMTDFTNTTAGTTGAQTINKRAGSVNFAAAATSLVVTNSTVTTSSIIQCTVGTNDTTMKSVQCVVASGSFTIFANAAATAETRVYFNVIN